MTSLAETTLAAIRKSIGSLVEAGVELPFAEDAVRKLQGRIVGLHADPIKVIDGRIRDCCECFRAAWWELRQSEIEICEKFDLVSEEEPEPTLSPCSNEADGIAGIRQAKRGSIADTDAALAAINKPVNSLAKLLAEVEYAQRAVDELNSKLKAAAVEPIDEIGRQIHDALQAVRAGHWQLLKAKLESTVALTLHGRCPWCQQELEGWDAADAHVWECAKAEAAFIDPTLA